MTRIKASLTHLAISGLVVLTLVGAVIWLWYPLELLRMAGMIRLIALIAIVDIVSGPLLTLVLYRKGKPGLAFDLTVVALAQCALLAYGLHILAANRPIFLVAVHDRIELVTAQDVSDEDLARATGAFARRSWTGPLLVGAPAPSDPAEREALIFDGLEGRDIHLQPRYYRDYAQVQREVGQASLPLLELLPTLLPTERERIERAAAGVSQQELGYYPIVNARRNAAIMLVRFVDGQMLGPVDVDPWNRPPAAPDRP